MHYRILSLNYFLKEVKRSIVGDTVYKVFRKFREQRASLKIFYRFFFIISYRLISTFYFL
ncbi:hypothetical protein PUN28_000949 [Cardiocondyla obscurior]|uniref:Uncharacterized protein n=1 Tax=Cardiocondyla obscurior TaxID=286306 RepID=A0AAW2H1W2_9HYME